MRLSVNPGKRCFMTSISKHFAPCPAMPFPTGKNQDESKCFRNAPLAPQTRKASQCKIYPFSSRPCANLGDPLPFWFSCKSQTCSLSVSSGRASSRWLQRCYKCSCSSCPCKSLWRGWALAICDSHFAWLCDQLKQPTTSQKVA